MAAIVESSNDAIYGRDLDGNVTSWNPAAEHLYGYTAEEAVGSHISMLIPDVVGVELSGEVVDSPQAVITAQVEGGVVVRMAVLYELLEGARAPEGAKMSQSTEAQPA